MFLGCFQRQTNEEKINVVYSPGYKSTDLYGQIGWVRKERGGEPSVAY